MLRFLTWEAREILQSVDFEHLHPLSTASLETIILVVFPSYTFTYFPSYTVM